MKLLFENGTWKTLQENEDNPQSIYLDGYLKQKLDFGKDIIKKGWDLPILIDGLERSGKSTLGMTVGYYMSDGKLGPRNFAAGMDDCAQKIRDAKKGDTIIIDEGSLVFSSKDAMVKAQRQLLKILDVCGQKNLTLIVCLPSFFDLAKQIAVRRSRFLLHVYPDSNFNRGRFAYWGQEKKEILYERARKHGTGYRDPRPDFIGRFSDFKPSWYVEYLEIKNKSLQEALNVDNKSSMNEDKKKLWELRYKLAAMRKMKINSAEQLAAALGITSTRLREWGQRGQIQPDSLGKVDFEGLSTTNNININLEEKNDFENPMEEEQT